MSRSSRTVPKNFFNRKEIKALDKEPRLCNQSRRTFLKWGSILGTQAIAGGGVLNLATGQQALADDTFDNVIRWNYSVCGFCSFGCISFLSLLSGFLQPIGSSDFYFLFILFSVFWRELAWGGINTRTGNPLPH